VNRRIHEIDHLCHAFIVRHAPSAGHLRYASGVLRLDVALERIGDYADSIGRELSRLSGPPPGAVGRDIELIAQQARVTLSQALEAFHEGDVVAARRAAGMADQTDYTLETVIAELLRAAEKEKGPLRDIFGLLRIINLLKRVAEQAENISEQTIFVQTGQEPDARVHRVLFVDERNAAPSQMAEAYARKAFPASGRYYSAGTKPDTAPGPALVVFMEGRGVDVRPSKPNAISSLTDRPEHFHVVVLMEPGLRDRIGHVPYRTTVIEWVISADPSDLAALYQEIVVAVQDLMTTLAGPDAR
jgi:phosphate transport system protein